MDYKTMLDFRQSMQNVYSKERLRAYGDLKEHNKNLNFIGTITPKITKIEISLRNMLDFALSERNLAWLLNTQDEYLRAKIEEIKNKSGSKEPLSHHQILSRLTLGVVVKLIKDNGLQNVLLDLSKWNFKDFSQYNRNFFRCKNKKYPFLNITKINIALNLLTNIRNRSFHWENLLKIITLNNTQLSRIHTKEKGVVISVDIDKIEFFLNCFLKAINEDLLKR